MYEDSVTELKCAIGMMDRFKVEVVLHNELTEPSLVYDGEKQIDR